MTVIGPSTSHLRYILLITFLSPSHISASNARSLAIHPDSLLRMQVGKLYPCQPLTYHLVLRNLPAH
jgi:hypothetical protein